MAEQTKSPAAFRSGSASLNSVRLRRVFDVFDQNHDNIISVDELGKALNRLGIEADPSQVESLVKEHIRPGNDGLTYEDFETLHRSLDEVFFGGVKRGGETDDSDLIDAFKVFDEDGDGYISTRELQDVLRKLGIKAGKEIEKVEGMISAIDRNDDGRVNFVEFKDMMRNAIPVPLT